MTQKDKGFTLVELMLSMAFIAMLLLAIALLVLQITSVYNKGLTLKSANEAGQLVSSDIQRTLNSNNPNEISRVPDVSDPDARGGRFCIGRIVYAWNYGEYLVDNGPEKAFNHYENDDGKQDPIRLVKFANTGTTDYCTRDPDTNEYPNIPTNVTALLDGAEADLALHQFVIADQPVVGDGTQRMYTIMLELGTRTTSVFKKEGCQEPESRVDDEYCAVNQFEFTARAGNRNKEE